MSGTHALVMGDRGRLVIPADIRESANLRQGTKLILVEVESGLLLMTVEQARARVAEQLSGRDLVSELITERRAEALAEDRA